MYCQIYEYVLVMRGQRFEFQDLCFSLLFNHFYHQDILNGTATPEEIKFAKKTKENMHSYLSSSAPVNDKKNELIKAELDLASGVMVQKKLPAIFDPKTYDNRKDLYRALMENFNFYLADIPEDVNTTIETSLKNIKSDNPKDNYQFLSKYVLRCLYHSNNSIKDPSEKSS